MKIRIGGVPEHFNLPVHLAIESGAISNAGIEVEWITYDGGTGQMCNALRDGEVDLCILLTEGIIKDIIKGNPCKIISNFVNTPLIWGIHTGVNNTLQHHQDIYTSRYAISRYGSGSHLMAIVDANTHGKIINMEQFHVIDNLQNAIKSLTNGETDTFYWEKYTTKPYVDKGEIRRIGEFVTPWPCFVMAATDTIIREYPREISRLLRKIYDAADAFMMSHHAIDMVSERYHLNKEDTARWFHMTEWATHGWVSDKMIKSVIYNLHAANILDSVEDIPELIWKRE